MFFKNASPDQVTVAKEGQLQNTSMATTPNTQNHPPPFFLRRRFSCWRRRSIKWHS